MEKIKKKILALKWKDKLFLACLVVFVFLVAYEKIFSPTSRPEEEIISSSENSEKEEKEASWTVLRIGEVLLSVELADDQEKRIAGLSGREGLADDQGMLFLHQSSDRHVYSMRGMRFPLDFVFINQGRVVDFQEKVAADFAGEISGREAYDAILELPAGWVEKNGLQIGDRISAEK